MHSSPIEPRYLMRWDHSRDQRLSRDVVTTKHRLAELSDFSDEGLSDILDRYPRRGIHIFTMGENPCYPNQLRSGLIDRYSGIELIDFVQRGRLQIQLINLLENFPRLDTIARRLLSEVMECQPGLRVDGCNGVLEISSPRAMTYLQCNQTPTVFWQIRGSKTAWIYPQIDPMSHQRAPHYFEPAFDDHSTVIQHQSSNMIGIPQFTPHRFVNDNTLSVSLQTTCQTSQSQRINDVCNANHLLNRLLPWKLSQATDGIAAAAKRGLWRLLQSKTPPTNHQRSISIEPSFRIDPNEPDCVGSLDHLRQAAKTESKPTILPALPTTGLTFGTTTTASTASEN